MLWITQEQFYKNYFKLNNLPVCGIVFLFYPCDGFTISNHENI